MNVQNEPKVLIEQKIVQFALVSTLVLGVLTALILVQFGVFSSSNAKASSITVPSGDIVYASTDPFSSLVSGDTIFLNGKLYLDQDYTLHQYNRITLIADGTNSEIKIFSGNNLYLGDSSQIILLNSAKIKIVGKCDSTSAIYIGGERVATCDGTGGTSFDDINGGGTLPVDWLSTSATLMSNTEVELKWSTAAEINNKLFQVQYSLDGKDWIDGQIIPSKAESGNSNDILNYRTTHFVAERIPHLYFRIKQVDFDEKYDFSDIMVVSFTETPHLNVSTLGNSKIKINTNKPIENGAELKIYNMTGSLVLNQEYVSDETITLPSPGVYIIEIGTGAGVQRVKHMVQ